jgi:hypothetical protein
MRDRLSAPFDSLASLSMATGARAHLILAVAHDVAPRQKDCAASGGYRFICGPQNAEDLVIVPNTDSVVASAMLPGAGLYLVDARRETSSELHPGDVASARQDMRIDGPCPGSADPRTLTTHGLNLWRRRPDVGESGIQQYDDDVWVGTFSGDRIGYVEVK